MSPQHERQPLLRILGKASSINVRKVLWTCEEIGLPFMREDWGSGHQSTAKPEFLALNPNGLVPVVIDESGPLWESNSICRYLAAKHDRIDLLPAEPRQRAGVEQWMDWQATDLNASWHYAFQARVRRNPLYQDDEQVNLSLAEWNNKTKILEQRLTSTGAFVAGDSFTLADVVIALSLNRWLLTPMPHPHHPAIAAYCDRLKERSGCRNHCFNGIA